MLVCWPYSLESMLWKNLVLCGTLLVHLAGNPLAPHPSLLPPLVAPQLQMEGAALCSVPLTGLQIDSSWLQKHLSWA